MDDRTVSLMVIDIIGPGFVVCVRSTTTSKGYRALSHSGGVRLEVEISIADAMNCCCDDGLCLMTASSSHRLSKASIWPCGLGECQSTADGLVRARPGPRTVNKAMHSDSSPGLGSLPLLNLRTKLLDGHWHLSSAPYLLFC